MKGNQKVCGWLVRGGIAAVERRDFCGRKSVAGKKVCEFGNGV